MSVAIELPITGYTEAHEVISKLVNLSLASAQIKDLIIEQPVGRFPMRAQLHIMILSQSGVGKSTILNHIGEMEGSEIYTELTGPGLIGSIDRKMGNAVIVGAAWENRGRLLLLDEFRVGFKENDALHPLLQLMEAGFYKKKVGLLSVTQEFKEPEGSADPDYFFQVKDGNIRLKTRFGAILATMRMVEHDMRSEMMALLSRCIPYRWEVSDEELKKVALGHKLFIPEKKRVLKSEVVVRKKEYLRIKDYVDSLDISQRVYLRAIGDCCRAYASLGSKHDFNVYELICKLKHNAQARHDKYMNFLKKHPNLGMQSPMGMNMGE